MSTGNPNYGVGGTAQDGGLSTADTVRDGGPDGGNRSSAGQETFASDAAPGGSAPAKATRGQTSGRSGTSASSNTNSDAAIDEDANTRAVNAEFDREGNGAHVGNRNRGVGGTAGDGGMSTAATVADGGPDPEEEDGEFKP